MDRQSTAVLFEMLKGTRPASATALLAGVTRLYGLEVLNWDPTTLGMELESDMDDEPDANTFDKLMAAINVITTDTVYRDVAVFDDTINAFNDVGVSQEEDIPTVEELCLTVAEIFLLDPEPAVRTYGKTHWHHDVIKYCRVVLDDEGISTSPSVLHFVPDRGIRTPKMSIEAGPDELAEVFAAREARTKEINAWVDAQVLRIGQQLLSLGIDHSEVAD